MSKELFLMRHGQTEYNVSYRIQGWSNSPLTQEGILQAKAAHAYFQKHGITFDQILSSDLDRAYQTAQLATDYALPVHKQTFLREWGYGSLESKSRKKVTVSLNNPPKKDYFVAFGGEDGTHVQERITQGILSFLEKQADPSKVLMVSHGSVIYQFLTQYCQDIPPIGNCFIFHFIWEEGRLSLQTIIDPLKNS